MSKQAFLIQHVGQPGTDVRQRADRVRDSLILPACEEMGYKLVRADQLPTALVTEPIVSALSTSHLVVADLSSPPWNDNVLMEIGFRLAIGRPIVLLADVQPKVEELPLHLQNRRILTINFDAPMQNNITTLREYIGEQQREMAGWRTHYPFVEFTVPLQGPDTGRFIYANEAAAQLYGIDDPEELLAISVSDADGKLKGFMPDDHRRAFSEDQARLFWQAVDPVNRSPVMAKVPAWLARHPTLPSGSRLYGPILLQHKFSPLDHSIVMRVAFVEVSKWAALGPTNRNPSSVLEIPAIFRDLQFKYDVFLSYNSRDHQHALALCNILRRFGLRVWFDKDDLVGRNLIPELGRAISNSRIIVAVLGTDGLGPWQEKVELGAALQNIVKNEEPFALLLLNTVQKDEKDTKRPPAESWWVQKLSADLTAD